MMGGNGSGGRGGRGLIHQAGGGGRAPERGMKDEPLRLCPLKGERMPPCTYRPLEANYTQRRLTSGYNGGRSSPDAAAHCAASRRLAYVSPNPVAPGPHSQVRQSALLLIGAPI